jgi:hypothetical protein
MLRASLALYGCMDATGRPQANFLKSDRHALAARIFLFRRKGKKLANCSHTSQAKVAAAKTKIENGGIAATLRHRSICTNRGDRGP